MIESKVVKWREWGSTVEQTEYYRDGQYLGATYLKRYGKGKRKGWSVRSFGGVDRKEYARLECVSKDFIFGIIN